MTSLLQHKNYLIIKWQIQNDLKYNITSLSSDKIQNYLIIKR